MDTLDSFAKRIRFKYPEYESIGDQELVERVLEKYPEYRTKVQLDISGMDQSDPKPGVFDQAMRGVGRAMEPLGPVGMVQSPIGQELVKPRLEGLGRKISQLVPEPMDPPTSSPLAMAQSAAHGVGELAGAVVGGLGVADAVTLAPVAGPLLSKALAKALQGMLPKKREAVAALAGKDPMAALRSALPVGEWGMVDEFSREAAEALAKMPEAMRGGKTVKEYAQQFWEGLGDLMPEMKTRPGAVRVRRPGGGDAAPEPRRDNLTHSDLLGEAQDLRIAKAQEGLAKTPEAPLAGWTEEVLETGERVFSNPEGYRLLVPKGADPNKYAAGIREIERAEYGASAVPEQAVAQDRQLVPSQVANQPRLFIRFNGQHYPVASMEDASAKWGQVRDLAMSEGAGSRNLNDIPRIVDETGDELGHLNWNGTISEPHTKASEVVLEGVPGLPEGYQVRKFTKKVPGYQMGYYVGTVGGEGDGVLSVTTGSKTPEEAVQRALDLFRRTGGLSGETRATGLPAQKPPKLPRVLQAAVEDMNKQLVSRQMDPLDDDALAALVVRDKAQAEDLLENLGHRIGLDTGPLEKALRMKKSFAPPDARPWYSKLAQVLDDPKTPAAMPAEGLLNVLRNRGVKPEEVQWSGMEEWLKGKGKVTKKEAQKFLEENKFEVNEIELGTRKRGQPLTWRDASDETLEQYQVQGVGNLGRFKGADDPSEWTLQDIVNDTDYTIHADTKEEAIEEATKILEEVGTGTLETRYQDYQLPGGKNYREKLFQLPTQDEALFPMSAASKEVRAAWADVEAGKMTPMRFEQVVARFDLSPQWQDDMSEAPMLLDNTKHAQRSVHPYQSSHFDEPNVLAHARMNDRKIGRDKVLFLEEVQSDWHQEGREKGYLTENAARAKRIAEWEKESNKIGLKPELTPQEEARFDELQKLIVDARQGGGRFEGVPDAPFKKTWHEMVMKRMIRQAVEEGKDGLAWTTGAQQASRYDLAKYVDRIDWAQTGEGTYRIDAVKGGQKKLQRARVAKEELPGLIGKDATAKILAGEGGRKGRTGWMTGELKGKDLQVGGYGMSGFYDKILPDFVNKFAKKWGGQVELKPIRTQQLDARTKDLGQNIQYIIEDLQTGTKFSDIKRDIEEIFEVHFTRALYTKWKKLPEQEAIKELHKLTDVAMPQTEDVFVHYLKFTPELKRAAMKQGFPLFSGAAAGVSAGLAEGRQE